jgi:vancomycin permeability regulator SanA
MNEVKTDVPALKRFVDLPAPGWLAVSRGAGFGLAILLGLNLMEVFVHSTSAVENWLTDLRPLSQPMGITVLAMASTSLLMFGMRPALPGPVQFATFVFVAVFTGFCGRELWQISRIVSEPDRTTAMIQPLGILMLFAVSAVGILAGNSDTARGHSSWIAIFVSTVLTILCFAVVTVQSGGLSDVKPAEAVPTVLVIGGQQAANGNLSEELTDRVTTGCRLITERSGDRLLLAGGSETQAMKALALESKVPEEKIAVNSESGNIESAIRIATPSTKDQSDNRVIIVSHWFELARIRIAAKRAGLQVTAVAAEQKHALFNQNLRVAREVISLLKSLCEPTIFYIRNSPAPPAK